MSEILLFVMAGFAIVGALDRILGNKLELGKEFEDGITAMGSLALAMLGIICLAPVLASLLKPVVVPVFRLLGADPAMFAGSILASDMGGGALAMELTEDRQAALFGGVLCGSMLGATVVLTIPVGLLAGGLLMGMPVLKVLGNLIPIVLIAGLIALGLWRAEDAMIRGFGLFGKGIIALITVGLGAGIFEAVTGIRLIPGLAPIEDGFLTVGAIAIVLAGAFPLVAVLTKVLRKPLLKLGITLGINETAAAGLLASLANSIATFTLVKEMDDRGKVVNVAFAVSAAFVFGDHMGFTAGFAPEVLPAMIVSKLVGGVSAVAVALWLTKEKM